MGNILTDYWTSFATLGDPSPPGRNLTNWSPVTLDNHQYLRIDKTSGMEASNDYLERINFWKKIMENRQIPI